MERRLKWIDIARGIGFLVVIYTRLEYKNDYLMHFLSPFFLTIFFFISGYLYKENVGFKYIFEQRTRTLLLPFLFLGTIMIALNQIVTFNKPIPLSDRIEGLLFQNGENQILWFIAALYIYSLAFYWVIHWAGTSPKLLIASLLLFIANVAYSIWLDGPQIPWHINHIGFGCAYMGLGKVYKYYEKNIDTMISKNVLLVIFAFYVITLWLYDVNISHKGSRYVIDSLIISTTGILTCIYASKLILNNNRLLLFIGANTLFYFAFHGKVYSLLQTIVEKWLAISSIGHTSELDFCLGILITFWDALILIPFAIFVNKYIPQILGKGFKLY